MAKWYSKVAADPTDLSPVQDAFAYFELEYEAATRELATSGQFIKDIAERLPGIVGYRYAQLQEIEAIMRYLEIQENKKSSERRRFYLEGYQRTISDTTAKNYAENDPAVVSIALLRNQMSLIRNKYLALSKQWETLHFQLTNIVKLHVAGMDHISM